jgi:hypothetical protein
MRCPQIVGAEKEGHLVTGCFLVKKSFEASLESIVSDGRGGILWSSRDLISPVLKRAAALFAEALTVREVAATLRISKSEAGRLRVRALNGGLLVDQTSVQ